MNFVQKMIIKNFYYGNISNVLQVILYCSLVPIFFKEFKMMREQLRQAFDFMIADFIFIVIELLLCLFMYMCRVNVNKQICVVLVFKVITIAMAFWGMNIENGSDYQLISDSKTEHYNKASILFLTMVYFKTFTLFIYLIFFLYFFLGTLIIIFTMIDFENQQQ